jgi:CRISPR locus-related DNA-binding protein
MFELNRNIINTLSPQLKLMARVLITPIYETESIVLAINRFSIERVFLLVSKKSDEKQAQAVKSIKEHYNKVIEIKEKKIELYDIVETAHQVKEIIDDLSCKDEIYLNITTGRRPQVLGVLFAGYKRPSRIKKIFYVVEDTKEVITIPILSFDLTENQQKILENIEDIDNISKLSDEVEITKAMVYRSITSLKEKGLIEDGPGKSFKLTEAGKIAMM